MAADDRTPGVEWTAAEREAVRVLYETWARLVAERERQAAARALREAAEAWPTADLSAAEPSGEADDWLRARAARLPHVRRPAVSAPKMTNLDALIVEELKDSEFAAAWLAEQARAERELVAERDRLAATVARVEALAEEWQRLGLPGMTEFDYGTDLRAALEGDR